jgi:hypothetical protein
MSLRKDFKRISLDFELYKKELNVSHDRGYHEAMDVAAIIINKILNGEDLNHYLDEDETDSWTVKFTKMMIEKLGNKK